MKDRKPLGVSLHQTVLDAVVDHLHEVAGTCRTDVRPATMRGRRQGLKYRTQPFNSSRIASNHQAVAFTLAPDAAAGPGIDEVKPVRTQGCCTPHRVFIVRVASINDDVALLCKTSNQVQRLLHDIARRDHHPYGPWRLELTNQRFDRCSAGSAKCGDPRHCCRIDVVNHHSMAALNQTLCHVCAHAAQTNHSQFHMQKPRVDYSLTYEATILTFAAEKPPPPRHNQCML